MFLSSSKGNVIERVSSLEFRFSKMQFHQADFPFTHTHFYAQSNDNLVESSKKQDKNRKFHRNGRRSGEIIKLKIQCTDKARNDVNVSDFQFNR